MHQNTIAPYGGSVDPAYASKLVTAYVVNGEALSRVNGSTVVIPGRKPTVITAPPARGNVVSLPAVELLSRPEYGKSFQTMPNQSIGPVGLHMMLEVMSSMMYRQNHIMGGGR